MLASPALQHGSQLTLGFDEGRGFKSGSCDDDQVDGVANIVLDVPEGFAHDALPAVADNGFSNTFARSDSDTGTALRSSADVDDEVAGEVAPTGALHGEEQRPLSKSGKWPEPERSASSATAQITSSSC